LNNSNTCPKCQSREIIVVSLRKTKSTIIPIAFTMACCVNLSRHVCGACGFTEEWIHDKNDIDRLRAKFAAKLTL
jgi:predicted nucleic-acid-binding Zn-ribbon protein